MVYENINADFPGHVPLGGCAGVCSLHYMNKVASVTFAFDGTEKEFAKLYRAIADIDLDIAAYSKGTTGVIEFMIGDLAAFKEQVAKKSAELGVDLITLDYLASERNV
jgi:hypothetical protein